MNEQIESHTPLHNQIGLRNSESIKSGHSPALNAWIEHLEDEIARISSPELKRFAPLFALIRTMNTTEPGDPFLPELVAWLESQGMPDIDSDRTGLTPLMSIAGTGFLENRLTLGRIQRIADFSNWDARDSEGEGILESALRGGDQDAIAYVMAYQEQRALRQLVPMTEDQSSQSRKTKSL